MAYALLPGVSKAQKAVNWQTWSQYRAPQAATRAAQSIRTIRTICTICAVAGLAGCAKSSAAPEVEPAPIDSVEEPFDPAPPEPRVRELRGGEACASDSVGLEQQKVSLYVLLDTSASMDSPTRGNVSRWEAIQSAALAFVTDSTDDQLNVGLQFFPQPKAGTQFTCRSNRDCGENGLCALRTCTGGDQVVPCNVDADCPLPDRCVPFGVCELAPGTACVIGGNCGNQGNCVDFQPRSCVDVLDCSPERYASPAVPIGPIAQQASAVTVELAGRQLAGVTPTAPALQGALDHAKLWAQTHPEERVVVILATDGLPTPCSGPNGGNEALLAQALVDTERVAAAALADDTSIVTYVIGVFGDQQTAANLDRLAAAGGSNRARIVDATGNVQEQFLTALQEVRAAALRCDFALPAATDSIDYLSASVSMQGGEAPGPLAYVGDAAACGSGGAGWHYDTDPESSQVPSSISLCPSTCELVRQGAVGSVNLQLGCATILR